jgi:ribosomal protein S18 acetylase RimI-like enzyme/DNA-binding MarR family transcriptional regulator
MQEEIYFELGIGTRIRRLYEQLSIDADRIYEEAGLPFRVSYFYVIYALSAAGSMPIAKIAKLAGFSHSAVSQTIKRLTKEGLVETTATSDGRQKLVSLSRAGEDLREKLSPYWAALEASMKDTIKESGHDLMAAISGVEAAYNRTSLYDRVHAYLKQQPVKIDHLEVVPFHTAHRDAYRTLNVNWMETTPWSFEAADMKVLENPEGYILDKGGEIFFALNNGEAVGTVTMKQAGPGTFELAKLIVIDQVRGLGAGVALCQALIERFQARGGQKLFLETNSELTPAITLYQKVGFKELPVAHRSYDRTDFYMEWQGQEQKMAS